MSYIHNAAGGAVNLQATLSASSAGTESADVRPHHPITCTEELALDIGAGEFRCPHCAVKVDEERTVYCVQHSIALLLIELAVAELG